MYTTVDGIDLVQMSSEEANRELDLMAAELINAEETATEETPAAKTPAAKTPAAKPKKMSSAKTPGPQAGTIPTGSATKKSTRKARRSLVDEMPPMKVRL